MDAWPRHLPDARWLVAIVLAAATAVTVTAAQRDADAARRAWGDTAPVVVATRDLRAGDVVGAGDVEVREWPVAVVPPGAVRDAPTGRALRADVGAGEVLVRARVAAPGSSGGAAAVPDGWRAVAVATGPATVAVMPGDVVDLYATADPTGDASGLGSPAVEVTAGARVVAVDDHSVTVAVPAERVARVAYAVATGTVTLALEPAGS